MWCPLVYKFLPEFCYTCGRIGHVEKCYEVMLKEGEVQQFLKNLRFIPEKKRWDDGSIGRSGWQKPLASKDGKGREKDYFNPPRKPITTSQAMQVDVTEEAKGTSDDEGGKMRASEILKDKKRRHTKEGCMKFRWTPPLLRARCKLDGKDWSRD
ncbi:hypothetical protein C2845_PM02G15570 [Panicum miliaceum]|uniref:CCHC-type domain-containing protein n=1 Tax=Panicum miliaceum TaxID=4540 RepID=A0A3L6SEB2_PANMI|nr:hypothetical protein C2845_PM02G15570 [Panicum miliaceum]